MDATGSFDIAAGSRYTFYNHDEEDVPQGEDFDDAVAEKRLSTKIDINRQFKYDNTFSDVGFLTVRRPFSLDKRIRIIYPETNEVPDGTLCSLVGWTYLPQVSNIIKSGF